MGTLRTILAVAVVFAHSWPAGSVSVGGRNAVQLFYVISGFLVSYVLVEKKTYTKVKDFYINRYLRLHPIYLCVATLTLVTFLAFNSLSTRFIDAYRGAPMAAQLLLSASNLLSFG